MRLRSHKAGDRNDRVDSIRERLGKRSIVLIGLMGAGKTAIGRRLASRLGLEFTDADNEIESAAGKSISDIFTDHGEAYFRRGEEKVIARLLKGGPQVLATGGGAYMSEATRKQIGENGISVWLKGELPVLVERVKRRHHRPLLHNADPEAVMKELMEQRYPVYAGADITVQSREIQHDVIVGEIIVALTNHLAKRGGTRAGRQRPASQ